MTNRLLQKKRVVLEFAYNQFREFPRVLPDFASVARNSDKVGIEVKRASVWALNVILEDGSI